MIAVLPEPTVASPAYALPRIPYLRLRITLRATERASLPPYRGSLLRGAFGHALRAIACSMGSRQACAECRLRRACPYPRLFETLIDGEPPPFLRGLPTAPRPYVFEPRSGPGELAPGDPLDFDLLLFGQAADLSPYALLAVERMAAAGLGARRHRFSLDRVEAIEPGGASRELFAPGREPRPPGPASLMPTAPTAQLAPLAPAAGSRAIVRFLTPTRVKSGGHLRTEMSFRALAFTMLRRTLEIAYFHLPGAAINWTFRPLLERAGAVRVAASDLRWQDLRRYSSRQGRAVEMGGFVGAIELEGDLAPFAALLGAAEVLHVGKGATFGLGRIAVEGATGAPATS